MMWNFFGWEARLERWTLHSLLDTDVVSQRTKERRDIRVVRWFQGVQDTETFLSVISLEEIRYGIELMDLGRKRERFEVWLKRDLRQSFGGRLLAVDDRIAEEAGLLVARGRTQGVEPKLGDALIAATARVHGLRVATLNQEHFKRLGVELVVF